MPEWKTVLYAICAIVLLILIFFWFVTGQMSQMAKIHPILFDLAEMIRCRFEMGVCLSIYPNPTRAGSKVEATIRTQVFYNNQHVCLARNYKDVLGQCKIENEICKISFEAKAGYYYAFLDSQGEEACVKSNRAIPFPEEAKSKDVELVTFPYAVRIP